MNKGRKSKYAYYAKEMESPRCTKDDFAKLAIHGSYIYLWSMKFLTLDYII